MLTFEWLLRRLSVLPSAFVARWAIALQLLPSTWEDGVWAPLRAAAAGGEEGTWVRAATLDDVHAALRAFVAAAVDLAPWQQQLMDAAAPAILRALPQPYVVSCAQLRNIVGSLQRTMCRDEKQGAAATGAMARLVRRKLTEYIVRWPLAIPMPSALSAYKGKGTRDATDPVHRIPKVAQVLATRIPACSAASHFAQAAQMLLLATELAASTPPRTRARLAAPQRWALVGPTSQLQGVLQTDAHRTRPLWHTAEFLDLAAAGAASASRGSAAAVVPSALFATICYTEDGIAALVLVDAATAAVVSTRHATLPSREHVFVWGSSAGCSARGLSMFATLSGSVLHLWCVDANNILPLGTVTLPGGGAATWAEMAPLNVRSPHTLLAWGTRRGMDDVVRGSTPLADVQLGEWRMSKRGSMTIAAAPPLAAGEATAATRFDAVFGLPGAATAPAAFNDASTETARVWTGNSCLLALRGRVVGASLHAVLAQPHGSAQLVVVTPGATAAAAPRVRPVTGMPATIIAASTAMAVVSM